MNNSLQDAKDALSGGEHLGALGSLSVCEMYAKKAEVDTPEEVTSLRTEANNQGMNFNLNSAREFLNKNDYAQSEIAMTLARMYAQKMGLGMPEEIYEIEKELKQRGYLKEKYSVNMESAIENARRAIDEREYLSALSSLNVVEMYADKMKISIPRKIYEMRRQANEIAVETNIRRAEYALNNENYMQADICLNLVSLYSKNAKIPMPRQAKRMMDVVRSHRLKES